MIAWTFSSSSDFMHNILCHPRPGRGSRVESHDLHSEATEACSEWPDQRTQSKESWGGRSQAGISLPTAAFNNSNNKNNAGRLLGYHFSFLESWVKLFSVLLGKWEQITFFLIAF